MKNKTLISICLGSLLAFTAPLTLADTMHSEPGQMGNALKSLKSKGYVIVKKIEFENKTGDFKAKVVNAEGKNIEIMINSKTGELAKPSGDITGFTAEEIAQKVSDAGYPNIYEINTEIFGNQYDVKAMDNKGKKVSLKVDVKTGSINKITE